MLRLDCLPDYLQVESLEVALDLTYSGLDEFPKSRLGRKADIRCGCKLVSADSTKRPLDYKIFTRRVGKTFQSGR